MFRADLHCHSSCSDGVDSPDQLLLLAHQAGLRGLSITDHDTIAAYSLELLAQKKEVFLLPGVEFSAMVRGEPVHILAYAFCLNSEGLRTLCQRHQQRRVARNLKIVEKLRGLGITLDLGQEFANGKKSWGRPHIAYALVQKGVVGSIEEAFALYLAEGKPAYETGEAISVEETLRAIKEAKGKAVIAHPHLIKKSTTLRTLLNMPFDGLEGYYARFAPEQEKKWIELAKKKNWMITGGSDYHGPSKAHNNLGASWVGQETFDQLYHHFLAVNPTVAQ